jgi:hypothetical protein
VTVTLGNGKITFLYDPWNLERPHIPQQRFHAAAYKIRYRAAFAGTGSGKTACGVAEDIRWCMENQGIVGYIYEPSFPMFRDILFPTLQNDTFFGTPIESHPFVRRWNKSEKTLSIVNPIWQNQEVVSTLHFCSLEDVDRAEGPNIDFFHIDEARLVRNLAEAWRVITRRMRGSDPFKPYPRGGWVTTTTDFPKSDLFNIFENPETKEQESKIFRWSIYDNPYLPADFIKDVEAKHKDGLAERFIYGRFATVGGGTFQFDSSVHVQDIPDRTLLKEIRYGIDFGWSNPSAIICVGYDNDDKVYALDEFYASETPAETLIEKLYELTQQYGRGEVKCDRSEPETIVKFQRGLPNKGIPGVSASAYGLRREDGIRELGARFAKAGDGLPRILISKRCVNLIGGLLECKVDVKEGDHAVDALRYSLKLKQYPPLRAFRFG